MATSGTKVLLATSRICTKCGKRKRLTQFSPRKKNPRVVWDYMPWCRPCNNGYERQHKAQSPRVGFAELVSRLRGGRHKRASHGFNIDTDFLLTLWDKQQGKCALTGLQMVFGQGLKPLTVTVDRIVLKKGYRKGNLRLVCFAVNAFRGAGTDEEMYRIAEALLAGRAK